VLLFLLQKTQEEFLNLIPSCDSGDGFQPNFGPEQKSYDIGPESHNFPLSEYLTIQRSTIFWDEPKHTSYNSIAARLRPYINWPQGMKPSPESRSTEVYFTQVR